MAFLSWWGLGLFERLSYIFVLKRCVRTFINYIGCVFNRWGRCLDPDNIQIVCEKHLHYTNLHGTNLVHRYIVIYAQF